MRGTKPEGYPQAGTFTLSPGNEVFGQLTVDGPKSVLYLRDEKYVDVHHIPERCIKGILHDLTAVSLLDCIIQSTDGPTRNEFGRYSSAKIFPHYIILGDKQVGPNESVIKAVEFVIDDAMTLFYDYDAFGRLINPASFIEQLTNAQAEQINRKIETGPYPVIQYFTGKTKIVECETVLGTISVSHNPHFHFPGPRGLRLDNTITVKIAPSEPIVFDETIDRLLVVLRYLGMIVGRPQNVMALYLHHASDEKPSEPLQVHWSLFPSRDISFEEPSPHPSDIILNALANGEAFAAVCASWLSQNQDRKDARDRFFTCFAKQRSFDNDRLIGAANMFDLLPGSALPSDVMLTPEIEAAKREARQIFSMLPESAERQSVLSELGRLGKAKLKHKIRHRAGIVMAAVPGQFPDLEMVADEAVNCRNHYVHGSDPTFDYSSNFEMVHFLTKTLEYIFATSDLIDAGWNMKEWIANKSTHSHPFSEYNYMYKGLLAKLKALMG